MSDHSLANFKNVIVEKQGHLVSKSGKKISLDEAITGFEPIQYDQKIFDYLKREEKYDAEMGRPPIVKSDRKFSMTNEQGERVEFSPNQVTKANESKNQGVQRKPSYEDLVILGVKPKARSLTRKFTDMLKPQFKIKTVDEVVSQIKGNNRSVGGRW